MKASERLKKNSRRLRRLFLILLVLIPIFDAIFWMGVGGGEDSYKRSLPVVISGELPIMATTLGFLISMIPTGVVMYTLLLIARLFGLYEKGKIFDQENVECFRAIGWSIIACDIADLFAKMALGPILTYHMPGGGDPPLNISLDFYVLLAGFSVLTIAWVMEEARKIKDEQDLFV